MDNWKRLAFENPKDIHIMVDNLPQPINPINVPSVPGSRSLDPQILYSNGKNHGKYTQDLFVWAVVLSFNLDLILISCCFLNF